MSNFCQLPLLLLCFVIPFSAAAPLHRGATASHWLPATATWYGSPDGDGSDGNLLVYYYLHILIAMYHVSIY